MANRIALGLLVIVGLFGCGKDNEAATATCKDAGDNCAECCSKNGAPSNVSITKNGKSSCTCKGGN